MKKRIFSLLVAVIFCVITLDAQELKSRPQGNENLKMNGTFEIPTDATFSKSAAVSMILADLNGDGINELVTGRENGISIQMGDINAFAPQTQAAWEAIRDLRFISPFRRISQSIELPIRAEIILSGDFNRDGRMDIATASRGGYSIFLIEGDGNGGFRQAREIGLGGRITSLVSGDVNRLDGLPDIIAGLDKDSVFSVSIYQGLGDIFNAEPENLQLTAPASQVLIGQFDENSFADIAVATGGEVIVFGGHGKDSKQTEPVKVFQDVEIKGIAAGDFIPDRDYRSEIAILGADGFVRIISRGELDTRPVSKQELMGIEAFGMQKQGMIIPKRILKQISASDLREKPESNSTDAVNWSQADLFAGTTSEAISGNALLSSARLSNRAGDDLILMDQSNNSLLVMPLVMNDDGEKGVRTSYIGKRMPIKFDLEGTPIAIAADRLNFDGNKDLIILEDGKSTPTTLLSAPEAVFVVNSNGDAPDANPGNGVCATAGAVCTLRAAIMEADRLNGADSITINSGIGTITINNGFPDDDSLGTNDYSTGDLDISCTLTSGQDCVTPLASNVSGLTITGAVGGNIIAGGTFAVNPNGDPTTNTDRIFDVGMDGVFGGGFGGSVQMNVTMSNLTIQNGNVRQNFNTGTGSGNFARGGAFRYDGFGQGGTRGTLSLTSVTIQNNQADHNSGGIFDQFASVSISSSTVSGNIGKAGPGGGLQFAASTPATLSVSGSTFSANEARTGPIFASTATDVDGGGIYATLDSNTAMITTTNFTNNISHDDGGAIYVASGATTVTGGTMSGNTSRDDGGAVAGDNDTVSAMRFMTLSGVTIQGNTANSDNSGGGDGGGIFRDRGTLNVTNCTIGGLGGGQPNNAVNGGGIAHAFRAAATPSNVAAINIDNGSIAGNNAATNGGGVFYTDTNFGTAGTLVVGSTTTVSVNENNANVHGGGFAVSGGAAETLTRATFSGNDADADANNSGDGGGLYHNNNGGTTTIASTVAFTNNGNGATTTENGGAIHHSNGTLTLNSPAVSGNDADVQGGGLFVSGGTVNVNGVSFSADTFPLNAAEVRLTGGTTNFSGTIGIPGELSIAGGTLSAGSSTVNLGEDFHFSSGTFTAGTSTFNFNGAGSEQIYGGATPTFNNLTDANTAALFAINNNVNVNGNLTVNSNATLNPAAATIVGGTGTLTGNGTVRVTRTAATADLLSQYTITNKTLTNLLVDYVGAGAQVMSGVTYGAVRVNNASSITLSGTATVNGLLTLQNVNLNVGTGTLNINNGNSFTGGAMILGSATGTVNYGQGSNGQSVIPGNYGNLTFNNFDKILPTNVGIAGTFTPGSGTPTVTGNTINFNGSSSQNIPVFPYNNLTLNNAAGATLGGNTSVPGVLTLTAGILATGVNTLTVANTGSLARTSGFVNGSLRKDFTSTGAFVYAVGTASGYAPVNVNVTAGAGNLTVTGIQGPMPNIDGSQALQRYWNLTGTGVTANLVFNYNQIDVLGNESLYLIHRQPTMGVTQAYVNLCPGSPCVDAVANTGTINGVTLFSNWTIAVPLPPTASNVSVAGRVLNSNGGGVHNAAVLLTRQDGHVSTAVTNSFGYYRFDEIPAGATYVVSVRNKEYQFASQTITVQQDIQGLDLIATN